VSPSFGKVGPFVLALLTACSANRPAGLSPDSAASSAVNVASAPTAVALGHALPPPALHITASGGLHSHSFLPKTADPDVSDSTFSGPNLEVGEVDTDAATMLGKLVVNLGGAGKVTADTSGVAAFAVKRGFHVFAPAYDTNFNIGINDAAYYGDARREELDGTDHTSHYAARDAQPAEELGLSPPDGVERRVRFGLAYLAASFPDEDWSYFLMADGEVRWSDVILTGVSHGASSAARFAMILSVGRVLSFSGPCDNTCTNIACTDPSAVIASWFSEAPATPIDRFYALTGVRDPQHVQHLVALERLHYVGAVTEVDGAAPPYGESHRLQSSSGDHSSYCGNAAYRDVCNYMLGVPPENAAGVP
jgi:hypothetical protein